MKHGIKLVTEQLGDIFTKGRPKLGFEHLIEKLMQVLMVTLDFACFVSIQREYRQESFHPRLE